MSKRPRQISSSTSIESITSEHDTEGKGAAGNTQRKKDHAHREKKRRGDLNICYGELMALLMQVDPEVGGSFEVSVGADSSNHNYREEDNHIPEVIPVENLLPRRDLVNRAVAMIRLLHEENEKLEDFIKEKRKGDLEKIRRQKEYENAKKATTTNLDSLRHNNFVQQLIDVRKDHHHHTTRKQLQQQQTPVEQNNFNQHMFSNPSNQLKEQLQDCLRGGGYCNDFARSNSYDIASAAAQQILLSNTLQQQKHQQQQHEKSTMMMQQDIKQNSFQRQNNMPCSLQQIPSSLKFSVLKNAYNSSNDDNIEQSRQNNDLNKNLLTACAAFMHGLATS